MRPKRCTVHKSNVTQSKDMVYPAQVCGPSSRGDRPTRDWHEAPRALRPSSLVGVRARSSAETANRQTQLGYGRLLCNLPMRLVIQDDSQHN
ncbi:unnamed protein product [Protopolystoma xenopodis]|uniref:Uncharacterized protein n=1 Tax=Protopolystoma xenopodis TaxID=117903 RepID=A0A3S4ZXN9_9PLAT|nr:unnamed protein product [Protopolystoma xenopodis]